jgi:protein-S-isoprenylcysteine O-methyltransferase Ste14
MTVESFRWLVTPGCGVAALLLVYDTRRALRPRIAGEQPWRESRVLGIATLVLGTLVLQRLEGPAWMNGAITVVLGLALVPLLWSSVTLRRLVVEVLRQDPDD